MGTKLSRKKAGNDVKDDVTEVSWTERKAEATMELVYAVLVELQLFQYNRNFGPTQNKLLRHIGVTGLFHCDSERLIGIVRNIVYYYFFMSAH